MTMISAYAGKTFWAAGFEVEPIGGTTRLQPRPTLLFQPKGDAGRVAVLLRRPPCKIHQLI
jgi:hypothetical protein